MEILLNLRPSITKLPSEYEEDIPLLGIGVCLEPEFDYLGRANQYKMYLLNDSWDDVMIDFKWWRADLMTTHAHGKLIAMSAVEMSTFSKEIFDSKAELKTEIKHKHFPKPIEKSLKPNTPALFSNTHFIRIINDRPMHFLSLFQIAELTKNPYYKASKTMDVDLSPLHDFPNQKNKPKKINTRNEIIELSAFQLELDLHYDEKINKNRQKYIIEEQMSKFQEYIAKAIRFKIAQVRIIHGKGQGILKSRIEEELKYNELVKRISSSGDGGSSIIEFYV